MPAFSVSRSIEIALPAAEVFSYLRDFKNWPEWSPWLICDPDCQLGYAADGDSYSWEGEFAGAGNMRVVGEDEVHHKIDYGLEFVKPWKSKADVSFLCQSLGSSSRVTWTMHSKLPFFLFWMKGMMVGMLGMDYDRGLRMLKEQLETQKVSSKLEFKGVQPVDACHFVGLLSECSFDEMELQMGKDFAELQEVIEAKELLPTGPLFTIYREWKLAQERVLYEVCCPVESEPQNVPVGMTTGTRPQLEAYQVEHTGSYQHLGNAWSAAMLRARAKLFKQSKKVMPFEQYITLPDEAGENGTVTLICLPVR